MYKVKYYIIMSQMRYYKLDGQLEEPQKKNLISERMFPFILKISKCL